MFLEIAKLRTILASETDRYLRRRGIVKYSATGVGEIVRWRGRDLYRYILAFNSDFLNSDLSHTLNIISNALTSVLTSKKSERKTRELERDIDKAAEMQRRILPEHEMRFQNYEIYGLSVPDRIVGGDFFDYLRTPDDPKRIGIAIGDAASKGFSAAAQALYASGALRMGVEFQTKIGSLMARINKLMHQVFPDDHFVTLFYGELTSDKNGLLIYANAGHNSPLLLHCATGEIEQLATTGQMLGPFPNEVYHTESAFLQKDDVLLLYTDGVVEAADEKAEFFGVKRLTELLSTHRAASSKEIVQIVMEEVQKHGTNPDYSDDITIVVIKRIA